MSCSVPRAMIECSKLLKVVLLGEARKCEPNLRSLTVGDFPGFLEPGDAIEFTCVCKKIQFKAISRGDSRRLSEGQLADAQTCAKSSNGSDVAVQ